ncbi:hypothetical protein [Rhodococcus sp. IEGM 1374]|uniref:hypothetical protein n=1 Tax=Rhodococcus sp. IEGM 1374 TaxID=3082221 RepID=UPI002952E133|nr:hypothetical protein [Rhodococcus sp. IEGM 1374]MDV7992105.1 hypothetical protein [Rhodococcus sp. IEGM 1374]
MSGHIESEADQLGVALEKLTGVEQRLLQRMFLEDLLGWYEQEFDPDGRPIAKAYNVISGPSRSAIQAVVDQLEAMDSEDQATS